MKANDHTKRNHLTKTSFVVKTLYNYNLMCYVKCSTSLLTFKAVAMSLYHIINTYTCVLHRCMVCTPAHYAAHWHIHSTNRVSCD